MSEAEADMNNGAMASTKKRRRPALACEQCRARKIKCDQSIPCASCKRSKNKNCSYAEDPRLPDAKRRDTSHGEDSDTLSTRQPEAVRISTPVSLKAPTPRGKDVVSTDSRSRARLLPQQQGNDDDQQEIHSLRTMSRAMNDMQERHNVKDSKPMRGIFVKGRLFGQSHWMNYAGFGFLKPLRGVFLSLFDKDMNFTAHYARSKKLGRAIKAHEAVPMSIPSDLRDYVPSRTTADRYVQAYLDTFETVFRVLHVPTFRAEYEQFWANGKTSDDAFVVLLLLVLSIGVHFAEGIGQYRPTALQWISAAQTWLTCPFGEKSRLTLTGIQIHCLVLIARLTNNAAADLIWISAGSLLRTAMMMGLHRDPDMLPRIRVDSFDGKMAKKLSMRNEPMQNSRCLNEIRRRLWATILELTLQSSLDSGGSPLISAEHYDCELPSNLTDDELLDEAETRGPTTLEARHTETSVQIAMMKSFPVRLRIVKLLNSTISEPTYQEVLRLHSDLIADSCVNNGGDLELIATKFSRSLFQESIAKLLILRCFLVLHQPYLDRVRSDPTYYFSHKVGIQISMQLLGIGGLDGDLDNDSDQRESEVGIFLLVSGGICRAVLFLAALSISFELLADDQAVFELPGTSDNTKLRDQYITLFERWHNVATKRLRYTETNIKGPLFSSVVLAMAKAKRAGQPIEPATIAAIDDSTEQSMRALEDRAAAYGIIPGETPSSAPSTGDWQSEPDIGRLMKDMGFDFDMGVGFGADMLF